LAIAARFCRGRRVACGVRNIFAAGTAATTEGKLGFAEVIVS